METSYIITMIIAKYTIATLAAQHMHMHVTSIKHFINCNKALKSHTKSIMLTCSYSYIAMLA